MTFLEAINAVLRRLREDAVVSSNSTDYSKLIGDFVNQAIDECEHAWDWNILRGYTFIYTAAGDAFYDFSTADVKIIEAINETKNWTLKVIPDEYHFRLAFLDTAQTGSPYYYSFWGRNNNYSQVKLYPTPTGVEQLRFRTINCTPAKAIDGSDDSDIISIPSLPVVLNAYAKAVSERGEDGGTGFNEADSAYRESLANSIAMDAALNHPQTVDWHAV